MPFASASTAQTRVVYPSTSTNLWNSGATPFVSMSSGWPLPRNRAQRCVLGIDPSDLIGNDFVQIAVANPGRFAIRCDGQGFRGTYVIFRRLRMMVCGLQKRLRQAFMAVDGMNP
jgi:hypothetical protein